MDISKYIEFGASPRATIFLAKVARVKAFLEGPFNGIDMNSYPDYSVFPLTQPFNNSPWNYDGLENLTTIPNNSVVDWVLIELRESPDVNSAGNSTII